MTDSTGGIKMRVGHEVSDPGRWYMTGIVITLSSESATVRWDDGGTISVVPRNILRLTGRMGKV